jgi:hypothetical protein
MVARNQLLRMENAIIFPNGFVTAFHQTDVEVITGASSGMVLSLNSDGTYTYYASVVAGTIYTGILDTASNTPVDVIDGASHAVASALIIGLSKAVPFLNKFYCRNGTTGIINLSDMVFIDIPGKTVRKLYTYTNRLWAVCTDGTLLISDNGAAATWDPLNITFLPNQEKIIDFIPVQGGVIVYSQTSVYAMYGSDYRDITFVLLLDQQRFSSGAVNIDNTVFIVGARGVYAVSLNGAAEIPHSQSDYFKSMFATFTAPCFNADVVQGVFLQRFEAILFMWDISLGGTLGFVFYPNLKAYSKVNQLLPATNPHILALNDGNTDFLMGTTAGTFVKSTYPSNATFVPRQSVIKTRYEDAGSLRDKVWRELAIETNEVVYGVTIDAFLNDAPVPVNIVTDAALIKGNNIIFLDLPRSQNVSFQLTINNIAVLYMVDGSGNFLTDDSGNRLFFDSSPGNYTLKELRVKYREAGPVR